MGRIVVKTNDEIEALRVSNELVAQTLGELNKHIKPGVTSLHLDKIAEEFIRDNKAEPGFLNYKGFPNSICASVNEEVVHGIPSKKELRDGDIISIDCGVLKNGYYGDSAYTFAVGEVDENVRRLMEATKVSLYEGIAMAKEGNRIGDIASAVQTFVEKMGFSVVREMVGHGIGQKLHEPPEVPNYGRRGTGVKLAKGMTIAIEPMINLGSKNIYQCKDGWTIKTRDGKPSAHYEHSIVITENGADILSTFKYIEENID